MKTNNLHKWWCFWNCTTWITLKPLRCTMLVRDQWYGGSSRRKQHKVFVQEMAPFFDLVHETNIISILDGKQRTVCNHYCGALSLPAPSFAITGQLHLTEQLPTTACLIGPQWICTVIVKSYTGLHCKQNFRFFLTLVILFFCLSLFITWWLLGTWLMLGAQLMLRAKAIIKVEWI